MTYKVEVEGIKTCDFSEDMTELYLKVSKVDKNEEIEVFRFRDIVNIPTGMDIKEFVDSKSNYYISKVIDSLNQYDIMMASVGDNGITVEAHISKESYVAMVNDNEKDVRIREQLIKEKMRQLAINALIAEGILNPDGSLKTK